MGRHLGDVLSEHISALVPEKTPEVLHEWFAEENQPLLATVLEVNVEVVLLDAVAVRSKLVLDFLHKLPLSCYLGRLYENVECHLDTLFVKYLIWDS